MAPTASSTQHSYETRISADIDNQHELQQSAGTLQHTYTSVKDRPVMYVDQLDDDGYVTPSPGPAPKHTEVPEWKLLWKIIFKINVQYSKRKTKQNKQTNKQKLNKKNKN